MAGSGGNTSEEPGAPQTLGDYVLLRRLGQGGMGQVWLAKLRGRGLTGIDKLCVVKTLRSSDDPEYERRFIDEARLIVLLTHKNICPVFDAGCFEGQYYVAMEHIAGRDLHALSGLAREQQTPLPVPVAIHIAKELLEALDAAHRMVHPITQQPLLIVHRDVSPQNVMVSAEGDVKLIDFGLAASSQKVEKTEPRVVMGKLAYMAPEQARGEALDDRTDQFAAGVILYELLANVRYYEGLSMSETWARVGTGGHEPPGLAAMEPALAAIVRRATAARRDDRYATCGDMCEALTAVELSRGAIASSRDVRLAVVELEKRAGLESTTSPELRRLERGLIPGATPTTVSHPPVVSSPLGAPAHATVSGESHVAVSSPGRAVSMPLLPLVGSLSPGVVSSSLPSLMPSPFEPAPVPPSPAGREHTRTFRIRREQSNAAGVEIPQSGHSPLLSEQTKSASVIQFRSSAEPTEITRLMPTTSEEHPPVVMRPSLTPSSVDGRQRVEPTTVYRGAAHSTAPEAVLSSSRRWRLVAAAAVIVVVVVGAGLWRASGATTTRTGSVDADVVTREVASIDAGSAPDVVADNLAQGAGVVGVGGSTPDAGTSLGTAEADTTNRHTNDDVRDGDDAEPPAAKNVVKPISQPRWRQIGPLPDGTQLVRVKFLKENCGDLTCYKKLGAALGLSSAERLIKECFDLCTVAPPPR